MTDQGGETGQLLTAAEVASLLGVSTMTVYRRIRAGQITALRIGRSFRIRRRDLEAHLRARQVQAEEQNS